MCVYVYVFMYYVFVLCSYVKLQSKRNLKDILTSCNIEILIWILIWKGNCKNETKL